MRTGRPPKPMALKLIQGSPKKNFREEITADGDLYAPPPGLTPVQQDYWRYAIEHAPRSILRKADRESLRTWCVAADLHQQANDEITKNGLFVQRASRTRITKFKNGKTVTTNYGVVTQPSSAEAVLNRQALIMMKVASELGFTPVSRARIAPGANEKSKGNSFANNAADQKA